MTTLMVTGHRKLVPAGWSGPPWPEASHEVKAWHERITELMVRVIMAFIEAGVHECVTGMAIGADTLFGEAVVRVKQTHQMALVAAVPFAGQETKWPTSSQSRYRDLLSRADQVVTVSPGSYTAAKMQVRNMWMVDHSQFVLAVWDGKRSGGTWNCLQYAAQMHRPITRLEPGTLVVEPFNPGGMHA